MINNDDLKDGIVIRDLISQYGQKNIKLSVLSILSEESIDSYYIVTCDNQEIKRTKSLSTAVNTYNNL